MEILSAVSFSPHISLGRDLGFSGPLSPAAGHSFGFRALNVTNTKCVVESNLE